MNVLIITGGSKGIGKALAEKYHSEGFQVISMARSSIVNCPFTQLKVDLSNIDETVTAFKSIFDHVDTTATKRIVLINNAGTLGTINTVGDLDAKSIAQTLHLNTTTPLILSNLFIQLTKDWAAKKQIINISSGAATSPYQGWSVYCTSKAALDMMTKVIASEQNELQNGVKCVAIYPGVVDTNMQTQIRKTPESNFKNVQRFIDLKNNDELYTTKFVADKIYDIDQSNMLKNGDVIDLREF
ncbi:MAG: SDR family NAD(P)-dependent oxidoreductase [Flavobacteriaceae bacterium]|nr:SDR family NAD(P)-dependent oxidoreductase [Flavobacteriaceae bacterium]